MVKIAAEKVASALAARAARGAPGGTSGRIVARGEGWMVRDVICTSGPRDRPFEEQHAVFEVAIVVAGTFQYRAAAGRELMTPGSLLLGRAGDFFECGHEHGAGDRCLAFQFAPDYFGTLVAGARSRKAGSAFRSLRVPPLREFSPLVARAAAALARMDGAAAGPLSSNRNSLAWEEFAVALVAQTLKTLSGFAPHSNGAPPSTYARITRAIREIEARLGDEAQSAGTGEGGNPVLSLRSLAREAGLSPYHFLRTFEHLTALTPHQYVRRARLRGAAARLADDCPARHRPAPRPPRILDIALDSGFADISNFNHAFRAEFGASPRSFRSASTR